MRDDVRLLNFDDDLSRRNFMQEIGRKRGPHEVMIKPFRPTRSTLANRYYFGCVVSQFRDALRDAWGDPTISTDQAHIELKMAVLGPVRHVNKETGDVLELVPTTHTMNVEQFTIYVDKAILFLAETFGIDVVDREQFTDKKTQRAS